MNDNEALRESGPLPGQPWPDGTWPDSTWPDSAWPGSAWPDEAPAGPGAPGPAPRRRRGLTAPLALPAGFGALLAVGAAAAATHGGLSAGWVLALAAAIVTIAAAVSEPAAALVLAGVGWLTILGFSRAPYAQLQLHGTPALVALGVIAGGTLAGLGAGLLLRRLAASFTLFVVDVAGEPQPGPDGTPGQPGPGQPALGQPALGQPGPGQAVTAGSGAGDPGSAGPAQARGGPRAARPRAGTRSWPGDLTGGIGRRRLLSGVLLVGGLPLLTWLLSLASVRPLGDILLVYLVAVVAIAVVGGFWPAVLAAITASLLVNWYFTPPVHTLTIGDGESLVDLLLFITVAVTVSSVVHLAAHRARQAARSTGEAQELLALAQTVLGGADSPQAVLAHLTAGYGGRAELAERAATAGSRSPSAAPRLAPRPGGGRSRRART